MGGGSRGDDRHRRLAVASEQGLKQVGLFRLGGQSGRRAATLYVHHYQRQLGNHGQVHGFGLETDTRTRSGSHCQRSGKGRSDGRGTARNLVLALHGSDTQRLVFGKLVQDVCRGSDGIRTKEQTETGFFGIRTDSRCRKRLNILKSRHHYENIEEYSNDITDDCGEAEMKLLKEKRLEDIQTAIKQLAPQQRRVVEMKLYNETGNQEIAQALNISVNTVKSLYTSALHNLRKMIQ